MNPKTKQEAIELAKGVSAAVTPDSPGDVAIFVPFPYIETVQKIVGDKLFVGAEVCKLTN
jgi:triosephosphate isomerase